MPTSYRPSIDRKRQTLQGRLIHGLLLTPLLDWRMTRHVHVLAVPLHQIVRLDRPERLKIRSSSLSRRGWLTDHHSVMLLLPCCPWLSDMLGWWPLLDWPMVVMWPRPCQSDILLPSIVDHLDQSCLVSRHETLILVG